MERAGRASAEAPEEASTGAEGERETHALESARATRRVGDRGVTMALT